MSLSMLQRGRAGFRRLVRASPEERLAIVLEEPVLLAEEVLTQLARDVEAQDTDDQAGPAFAMLAGLRSHFEAGPDEYPLGSGPIETLAARVERGELRIEAAETLAGEARFGESLSRPYVRALTTHCVQRAQGGDGHGAQRLHRLLRAALAAAPEGSEVRRLEDGVACDWIEVVHAALLDVPDPRLLRSAHDIGEAIASAAAARGDARLQAIALHRLGTMYLDAYTARFTSQNYVVRLQEWHDRFRRHVGPAEYTRLSDEDRTMPEPAVALRTAEAYLRNAAELRSGRDRGLTLKALVQALVWLDRVLDEAVEAADVETLARQAMELLDPERDREARLYLAQLVPGVDVTGDGADAALAVLRSPFDDLVARDGPAAAVELVRQAYTVIATADPAVAVSEFARVDALFERHADAAACEALWNRGLRLIHDHVAPVAARNARTEGVTPTARALLDDPAPGAVGLAAGLLAAAMHAPERDEEAVALELIDLAERIAPLFTASYRRPLAHLRGTMQLGLGVNAVRAEDWPAAVKAYARALSTNLGLAMGDRAFTVLEWIEDVVVRGGPDTAVEVLGELAPRALDIEGVFGEGGTRSLQRLYKHAVARLSSPDGSVRPDVLLLLVQMAKGLRFAAALAASSRSRATADAIDTELLAEITRVKRELATRSPDDPREAEPLLTEEMLLAAYHTGEEAEWGDAALERLENLERAFDAELFGRLTRGPAFPPIIGMRELVESIPPRTALVMFYTGASPRGMLGTWALVVTQQDRRLGVVEESFPDSEVQLGAGRRTLRASPLALSVAAAREHILEPPGPGRPLVREAAEALELWSTRLFGHLAPYLDELAASGIEHLCIVPHGPLHFFPIHLVGPVGRSLAERFTVSYLPNLQLLAGTRRRPALQRRRERSVSAIGMTFARNEPHGQAAMAWSRTETQAIARLFGGEPVLDEAATEHAVRDALENSRYVHISTHGRQNVAAPAFQKLYLWPTADTDGVLHAYELLSTDMNGLELLTLSACETALGRFDAADNLRGLPAACFLAGADAIVATLWDVDAGAAEAFFTVLYRELKAGRSRLQAFSRAQTQTREAYPAYRDWGAFYLMADWT